MPIPLVLGAAALGAAWLAAGGSASAGDGTIDDTAPDDAPPPLPQDPVTPVNPRPRMPDFDPLLDELRGDVPLAYLQRWMTRESGGNPCATGMWGGPWEAGIAQVYFDEHQRNVPQFGVTIDELRGACALDSQTMVRDLTDDEMRAQVNSLVMMAASYRQIAEQRLSQCGQLEWADDDVWALAKLQHALPVLTSKYLPAASAAGQAGSWVEFRAFVVGLDHAGAVAIDANGARFMPFARLFANAEYTAGIDGQ